MWDYVQKKSNTLTKYSCSTWSGTLKQEESILLHNTAVAPDQAHSSKRSQYSYIIQL